MNEPERQPDSPAPAAKRNWRVRWSLRALIVAITLGCLLFGWVSDRIRLGRVHQDVGQHLAGMIPLNGLGMKPQHGPRIDVRWNVKEKKPYTGIAINRATPFPDQPPRITKVEVASQGTSERMNWTDTELAFTRIREIRIAGLKRGEQLDEALHQIRRLEHLSSLEFYEVAISSKQLSQILADVQIHSLKVNHPLSSLGDTEGLRESSLERLNVAGTYFTNSGIDRLPESLVHLNLAATRVTDASLDKLPRLKNLTYLSLVGTRTSEEGIADLQRKMPRCEIEWAPVFQAD